MYAAKIGLVLNCDASPANTSGPLGMKAEVPPLHPLAKRLVVNPAINGVQSKPSLMPAERVNESTKPASRLPVKNIVFARRDGTKISDARSRPLVDV
jgi:hypothetical protein